MTNSFRILLLSTLGLALSACLPQATHNASPGVPDVAVSSEAEAPAPDVLASHKPGPSGEMPSGTLAPGAELEDKYVLLMVGTVNVDCAYGGTGKVRLTLTGKVLQKYESGYVGECNRCHQAELRAVYEDQGVRRWRPILVDHEGNFAEGPWEVDWSTVRFFFDRREVFVPGQTNECPADACVANSSPVQQDLILQPSIEEAPECPLRRPQRTHFNLSNSNSGDTGTQPLLNRTSRPTRSTQI
jgi:hypothetical protein